jgi:hypothetical protein
LFIIEFFLKNTTFWIVTTCRLERQRRSGGPYVAVSNHTALHTRRPQSAQPLPYKPDIRSRTRVTTDGQSVSQYDLVSSTLVGLATRYYFLSECCCLKYADLFLWGALSDEKTGLQFAV